MKDRLQPLGKDRNRKTWLPEGRALLLVEIKYPESSGITFEDQGGWWKCVRAGEKCKWAIGMSLEDVTEKLRRDDVYASWVR